MQCVAPTAKILQSLNHDSSRSIMWVWEMIGKCKLFRSPCPVLHIPCLVTSSGVVAECLHRRLCPAPCCVNGKSAWWAKCLGQQMERNAPLMRCCCLCPQASRQQVLGTTEPSTAISTFPGDLLPMPQALQPISCSFPPHAPWWI